MQKIRAADPRDLRSRDFVNRFYQQALLTLIVDGGEDSASILFHNLHVRHSGLCLNLESSSHAGTTVLQSLLEKLEYNSVAAVVSDNFESIVCVIVKFMVETRVNCCLCRRKFQCKSALEEHMCRCKD